MAYGYRSVALQLFFFFPPEKSFISIWSRVGERAPGLVIKLPSGMQRGASGSSPDIRGAPSSKAAGLQRLLVLLEGEPFQEILIQLSLGTSHPAEVGQVVSDLCLPL